MAEVSFRGWWFCIDASELRSKRSFHLLKFLVGIRIDESSGDQKVPVLTVPVG